MKMQKPRSNLRDIAQTILLAILMFFIINLVSQRVRIIGSGMEPTLIDGEYVIAERLSFIGRPPERGELVVYKIPGIQSGSFIDRIIGIPGDVITISHGIVWVNDQPLIEPNIPVRASYEYSIKLAADDYFILGDNRNNSFDSHNVGPISKSSLIGRPIVVYWPLSQGGRIDYQQIEFSTNGSPADTSELSTDCSADCRWLNQTGVSGPGIYQVVLSPYFTDDKTLFAISSNGALYRSLNSAQQWSPVLPGITVYSVAFSPKYNNDHMIVAGSQSHGIYISHDNGDHWTYSSFGETNPFVTSIILATGFDTQPLIYIGTSSGIFRSRNDGQDWDALTGEINAQVIWMMALSPSFEQDQTLFAATNRGIYKTTDQGETWGLVGEKKECQGVYLSPSYAMDKTIYSVNKNNVYKSVDDGSRWSEVTPGQFKKYWNWTFPASFNQVSFSPDYQVDETLFIATPDGLFQTKNAGQSWQEISSFPAFSVAVSRDDQTMFLGSGEGLEVTTDGGTTWTPANEGITSLSIQDVAISPQFHQDGTILAAGKGVWISQDHGDHWTISRMDKNITSYALAISPDFEWDKTVIAGTDNGISISKDAGQTWKIDATGIGNRKILSLAISPGFREDRTIFAGAFQGGLFRSTDGGSAWQSLTHGLPGKATVYAIAVSPMFMNDQVLFAATNQGVYYSADRGNTWNLALKNQDNNFFMAVAVSPAFSEDHTIYAAGDGVWKSVDGGGQWEQIETGQCCYTVTALWIEVGFSGDQALYIGSFGGGVLRSTDEGQNWEKLNFSDKTNLMVTTIDSAPGFSLGPIVGSANWGLWFAEIGNNPHTSK